MGSPHKTQASSTQQQVAVSTGNDAYIFRYQSGDEYAALNAVSRKYAEGKYGIGAMVRLKNQILMKKLRRMTSEVRP